MAILGRLMNIPNTFLYLGSLGVDEHQYKCGKFVGLSLSPKHDREIRADLRERLPFMDNTATGAQAQDVLEHLEFSKVHFVLDEVFRVLKPGGLFRLSVPDYRAPLLRRRSLYNHRGEVIADLMMGGQPFYDKERHLAAVAFSNGGEAHLWFPIYEKILELIVVSKMRCCQKIEFHHVWRSDAEYVCKPFDVGDMVVTRCPPGDRRAEGKPLSIIIDFIK